MLVGTLSILNNLPPAAISTQQIPHGAEEQGMTFTNSLRSLGFAAFAGLVSPLACISSLSSTSSSVSTSPSSPSGPNAPRCSDYYRSSFNDVTQEASLSPHETWIMSRIDDYWVKGTQFEDSYDRFLTASEFNHARYVPDFDQYFELLPQDTLRRLEDLFRSYGCMWIRYFWGFNPSNPANDVAPYNRLKGILDYLHVHDRVDLFTVQDGYRLSLEGVQLGSLPPLPSEEIWKTAEIKFLKAESKMESRKGYVYAEVNFQDPETSRFSNPDLAMTPDFEIITSYTQLTARKDFDLLLARTGIEKQMSFDTGRGPITTYNVSGFPVSTHFALLQVHKEAFYADGAINDQLKKAFENRKLIPLRWMLQLYEGTGTLKIFRTSDGAILEVTSKVFLREGVIELDEDDLLIKLESL